MEKETKHTPGEWIQNPPAAPYYDSIIGDAGQLVALIYGSNEDERKANAELIASAPTLKAENEELKARVEALLGNHGLTKAKIETIALQTELSEMKKEREELVKILESAYMVGEIHFGTCALSKGVKEQIESIMSRIKK